MAVLHVYSVLHWDCTIASSIQLKAHFTIITEESAITRTFLEDLKGFRKIRANGRQRNLSDDKIAISACDSIHLLKDVYYDDNDILEIYILGKFHTCFQKTKHQFE